ncbi:MAG: hypothetical protein HY853_02110 [Burkholderiales bacterium]|nr:hypothetical protein [Burkholderiales bacterium]
MRVFIVQPSVRKTRMLVLKQNAVNNPKASVAIHIRNHENTAPEGYIDSQLIAGFDPSVYGTGIS